MNENQHLILNLNDGKNLTPDIKFCEYNHTTGKYDITFYSGKIYAYGYQTIEWLKDPDVLDPSLVHITRRGRKFFNIRDIRVFHATATDYWRVNFTNGDSRIYDVRELTINKSCLSEAAAHNCLKYLRQISAINELKSPEGEPLLQKQYAKLDFIDDETAMAPYLAPEQFEMRTYPHHLLIFPFGGNTSQFQAVERALCNQVSVIQGPPGTGKTQTILNIIANLLIQGKTVQIVSNNNSATQNVFEKLASSQYNMGFLVAALGKSQNKQQFCMEQTGTYPDLSKWELPVEHQNTLLEKIQTHSREMLNLFLEQERLARAKQELDSLLLEIKYFEQFCSESGFVAPSTRLRPFVKSKTLMQLWQETRTFSERDRAVSFWFKLKCIFYGISEWSFYQNGLSAIITLLQSLFYQARQTELNDEISRLKNSLSGFNAKEKMDELTAWSMTYLRAKLFEQYGNRSERKVFTEDDLWLNASAVIQEYPIVLSTTFSSRSSLKSVTYDYLIMDEASQVDVATGALALSCARNAVIVGDLKQLPNVLKNDLKKQGDTIFESYALPQGYSFSQNSFLKSVCSILHDAPQTLLREHYRCHPKIIEFCNQKFYQNELIIMTEDHGEQDTLSLFKTVTGNHRREHINQRQIDVTLREVFPILSDTSPEDIGIIAPYRDQVESIVHQIGTNKIEVDTVHRFQGREKDTIVLTTVDDVVTDFSDDPYLLNVAISRAKKRLVLVTSCLEQPQDSNIGDLISYIQYNNFQVVQSETYSVFDLLYRQYTDARIDYLKRHTKVSVYDSENLMYGAIVDLLNDHSDLPFSVICHQPLRMLIRNMDRLDGELRQYAMNTATHIDFLIYNRISKYPVLAIEVDGFRYHKPGTRQYERDRMKDRILESYHIPLIRFPTNGSGEIEQIAQFLDRYQKNSRKTGVNRSNPSNKKS